MLSIWTVLWALAACGGRDPAAAVAPSGTFAGVAADGSAVTVTFTADARGFHGAGTVGDDALVLGGVHGWCGTGTLVRASGAQALVELTTSTDGQQVTLAAGGEPPVTLAAGGSAPAAAEGPFSGSYRAKIGAVAAEASLVQSGDLVAGVAQVGATALGISGRVVDGRAIGQATALDGSQVAFSAELADGALTVHGIGPELTLARGGR